MMRIVRVLLTALVLGSAVGCARPDWIESTLVTVDATGTWVGEWISLAGLGFIRITLRQTGQKLSGDMDMTHTVPKREGPVTGTIRGDKLELSASGLLLSMEVRGDEMVGRVLGPYGPVQFTLRRQ